MKVRKKTHNLIVIFIEKNKRLNAYNIQSPKRGRSRIQTH